VKIVPVRMTEAWLLHDEAAIRSAAGNPNGTVPLDLPRGSRAEQEIDPKARLHEAILAASGLAGRRRARLKSRVRDRSRRVADLIENYEPLRRLRAFQAFEEDLRDALIEFR